MREQHPYGEYIPQQADSMIIGSFPIGKFSNPKRGHEIKPHELNFFFGGEKNLLWKLLGNVFGMPVTTAEQVRKLLRTKKIGVGDVIRSCKRKSSGGSDSDLYDIEWNVELIEVIRQNKIKTLYFTSKKVETWFNKLFQDTDDLIKICLISPSGQSVRSLSRRDDFKQWRSKNPGVSSLEFIQLDYILKFNTKA